MIESNLVFFQLAFILAVASLIGYLIHLARIPLLIAYIGTGLVIALLGGFTGHDSAVLTILPEIGIAFVLFFVGMELALDEMKSLGKPIFVAAIVQILISSGFGFLIARAFGFEGAEAMLLGFGLSVSSTLVVIKLLMEKKDLSSLYGKLSLGILLVEDLVAVVILMILTTGSSLAGVGLQSSMPILALVIKGVGLLFVVLILSRYVLTKMFRAVTASPELLFLSALAWCFVLISISLFLGFSVIIGAFLAGVALASSPYHYEIQGKVKSLRDFFVALFFVYLGSQVAFDDLFGLLPIIFVFTLFAMFVKPVVFMSILGLFGFKKHTIFQTSANLSQVSEFSLVILVVGVGLGIATQSSLTVMALTGVISIVLSSMMITLSKRVYPRVVGLIGFFEHGKRIHELERTIKAEFDLENHVILIGAHRVGHSLVKFLEREKIPFVIIDFNPKIIQRLASKGLPAIYADIGGDPEILDDIKANKARLIISTAQDTEDNLTLLALIREKKLKANIIARAATINDAKLLYGAGADYVILPEVVAGDFVKSVLKAHWSDLEFFKDRARIELRKLNNMALIE